MSKKRLFLVTLCFTLVSVCGNVFGQGGNPVTITAPTTKLTCEQNKITLTANVTLSGDTLSGNVSYRWIKIPASVSVVDFEWWYWCIENEDNLTPFEIGKSKSVTVSEAGNYVVIALYPIGINWSEGGELIEITGGCTVIVGCMDPFSLNYNPLATVSNDSCFYRQINDTIVGCRDSTALSYNPLATIHRQSDCVYNATDTIYGCNDYKALNYNPFATAYDNSCVYASEENIFVPEITETPVDTVGTRPVVDCRLSAGLGITSATITDITLLDGNKIIVHWEIIQDGEPIPYNVEYAVTQEGINLFYLSIICKDGALRAKSLRSASEETGVIGYTVSATFNVSNLNNISQPKATGNLVVYPNPTTGIVNIGQQAEIKVYSLQGALLQETFGTQVNLSAYPQGVYQLQINGETVKVVKK